MLNAIVRAPDKLYDAVFSFIANNELWDLFEDSGNLFMFLQSLVTVAAATRIVETTSNSSFDVFTLVNSKMQSGTVRFLLHALMVYMLSQAILRSATSDVGLRRKRSISVVVAMLASLIAHNQLR